jgi:hypothetical protein
MPFKTKAAIAAAGQLAEESSELYEILSRHASNYSNDDKIHACMLYITEGNMKKVQKLTEIPYMTLHSWKDTEWWPLALKFCHKRKDKELEIRFSKVINDTIEALHDRVTKGDWGLDRKTGKNYRKPMTGRDLSHVLSTVHDKRQTLRGEAIEVTSDNKSQKDKLKTLESKFNEFSSQLKARTIDAEVERIM